MIGFRDWTTKLIKRLNRVKGMPNKPNFVSVAQFSPKFANLYLASMSFSLNKYAIFGEKLY